MKKKERKIERKKDGKCNKTKDQNAECENKEMTTKYII